MDENNEKGWMEKEMDIDKKMIPEEDNWFEGEVFLSTDGKHTVHFRAGTDKGRSEGGKWAKDVFDAILSKYGTKQAQAAQEYGIKARRAAEKIDLDAVRSEPVSQDTCPHDEYEVRVSSGFKKPENKGKAYKSCKRCNKFLGWATIT